MDIDKRIIDFIKEHHVLTLAVTDGDDLWCANAFYALNEKDNTLIITSEEKTRHIEIALRDGRIAGSIVLETETIGMIRGLQWKGRIVRGDNSITSHHRLTYLKRFPYAILSGADLWVIRFDELKYTDNRLGFGKKIIVPSERVHEHP